MKIQHLCKAFDGKMVLDHVSLTLESGGTACLMAPSGRGKTTLLRCIAGLETPDSGQITDLPERIAYVFQEDRLCDGFSAVDNIRLVTGKALGEGEIRRHLEELGLAGSLDQPVRELSGGMRRRVVISRAVCFGADLLLLDEPFKGLDDEARQQTADYILRHRGAAAILCVTHDREDAAALGGADIVTF
ncbi:sulfate transporter (plasmid) [Vescimonas fastidiosa]|uniref:Sulfate transporter n=1 Tax=Vescimonas fastidiosa TaxID=2714353 RepID=A0A810PUB4_9FIRM|nr:ATP-binding cassette domain-containing protein [Vescimonas fastidiosa]BCK79344.1 sulfate transporter [Vescimonas fastidiosa]